MSFRVLLIAALALSAFEAAPSQAESSYRGVHARRHHAHAARRITRIYGEEVGGHRYGYEPDPYIYMNRGYNAPGFTNNQTFWERVETQPDYPIR